MRVAPRASTPRNFSRTHARHTPWLETPPPCVLTHLRNLKKRTRSSEKVETSQVRALISAIDKAAKRGIIHRNAANRQKARLARVVSAARK